MDIETLKAKKQTMEDDIAKSVNSIVEKFRVETGFTPQAINIYFAKITEFGLQLREYKVIETKVTVEI